MVLINKRLWCTPHNGDSIHFQFKLIIMRRHFNSFILHSTTKTKIVNKTTMLAIVSLCYDEYMVVGRRETNLLRGT